MGSSRETNASFDHNFLFHPLDLKLEILMQKHDVKNQNPYWQALEVETLYPMSLDRWFASHPTLDIGCKFSYIKYERF
jgi:hypothetical protein